MGGDLPPLVLAITNIYVEVERLPVPWTQVLEPQKGASGECGEDRAGPKGSGVCKFGGN